MQLKLLVITEKHDTWTVRAANGAFPAREAGESFNLICQDMSSPPEHRMVENVTYRLKPSEVAEYWHKSLDKVLDVVWRSSERNKAGKVSLIGEILAKPVKA